MSPTESRGKDDCDGEQCPLGRHKYLSGRANNPIFLQIPSCSINTRMYRNEKVGRMQRWLPGDLPCLPTILLQQLNSLTLLAAFLGETLNPPRVQTRTTCRCLASVPVHRLRIGLVKHVGQRSARFRIASSVFNGTHVRAGNPHLQPQADRVAPAGINSLFSNRISNCEGFAPSSPPPDFYPVLRHPVSLESLGENGVTSPVELQVT